MQAKRLFAGLLSAVLLMTLLSVGASAAEYTPPALPDAFQGDGLYITATPFELEDGWIVENLEPFHDGYIKVGRREEVRDSHGYLTDSYGVYNLADRNGNIVLDYSGVRPTELYYGDGMCLFYDELTQLWGYMDMTGDVVIEPQFAEANVFSDGLAAVKVQATEENPYPYGENRYYIDKNGNKVLGPYSWYSELGFFSDGLAPVEILDFEGEDDNFCGYINKQGRAEITLHRGVGSAKRDQSLMLFGLDNKNPYDLSSRFSEGYAILADSRGDRRYPAYVVIDTEGNEVGRIDRDAPMKAEPKSVVHDGLIVMDFTNTEGGSGGGIGAVDIHGNIVIELGTNIDVYGTYFDSGVARGSGGSMVVDKQGNTVIPNSFTSVVGVDTDTLLAEVRTAYNSQSVVVDFGMAVSPFNEGLALCTVNMRFNGMSDVGQWHYVLEVHEGAYTGPGKVYNAATGQVTGGGSTPTDPVTPAGPSGWAVENVNTAVEAGIVPDTLQSAYTQATTRAEFCALAVELYETIMGTEITERATFSDTTDVNVEKMAGLGVVNGVGDGKFDPSASLTREEAATMLSRLANVMEKPLTAGTASFADNASISSWASEAVGQVQASGIMNGIEGNQFAPSDPYTREQSIVTMLRLYDFVK